MTRFREPLVGWSKATLEEMAPGEDVGHAPLHYAIATYDFDEHGGAVGDIGLGVFLPTGAVVPNGDSFIGVLARVVTVPTSAGAATLAVKSEAAADLFAAALISVAPWSTVGKKNGTGGADVLTTAKREITVTIGTADLTAGKVHVVVPYFIIPAA